MKELNQKNKFINAKFKEATFKKVSNMASRQELLQDYFLHCTEILLIKSVDFANERCPSSLCSTVHGVYVKPAKKI